MTNGNSTLNQSSIFTGEVIGDIAFVAGFLLGKGKIEVEDSRELLQSVRVWASKFEESFVKEVHGENYIELIDEYSALCLIGLESLAEKFLLKMKDPSVEGQPFYDKFEYMPGPTDEARTLQQIQCKALCAMYEEADKERDEDGNHTKGAMSIKAKAEYEKTVEVLVKLLGTEAHCNHVDQDKWSNFSDWHKSVTEFRPRRHYTVDEVNAWMKAHS